MKSVRSVFVVLLVLGSLALAAAGCSKSFMCHLNGTSCPKGPATSSGGGGDTESSSEPAPSEENSSSGSETSSSAEAEPAKRDCLPAGAKVKESDYHRCCCDCYRTQVEPVAGIVTCN